MAVMELKNLRLKLMLLIVVAYLLIPLAAAFASEADLAIPDLHKGAPYTLLGGIRPWYLLFYGACIIAGTLGISLFLRHQVKKLRAHESMLKVAEIIFQTCRTYLIQQGKFVFLFFCFIGGAISLSVPGVAGLGGGYGWFLRR